MIKVENLTKRYAGQPAIQNLNFEVGQGEIMGFLGPNGAGKTTTMRILASFMPPTSGRATIAGFDVFEQSLQARAHLGYMPENVPLYNDMRVTEYLDYRAALKGVPHRRLAERVGDAKELCGLKEVEKQLIGTLPRVIANGSVWRTRCCTNPTFSFSMSPPSASIQTRSARCAS